MEQQQQPTQNTHWQTLVFLIISFLGFLQVYDGISSVTAPRSLMEGDALVAPTTRRKLKDTREAQEDPRIAKTEEEEHIQTTTTTEDAQRNSRGTYTQSESHPEIDFLQPAPIPVQLYDERQRCSIQPSADLRFLGSGFNGHAFTIPMDCKNINNNNNNNNLQNTTVVMKLVTEMIKRKGMSHLGRYCKEDDKLTRQHKILYDRLLPNKKNISDDRTRQHFAIQQGIVDLPPNLIQVAGQVFNRSATKRERFWGILHQKRANIAVQGKIYAFADGVKLPNLLANRREPLTQSSKQQIVRDLIFSYHHMYQQGVIHCDMKMEHVIISPTTNVTTIIDFDEHKLLPLGQPPNQQQKKQQWQLLMLIANICDYNEMKHRAKKDSEKYALPLLAVCSEGGAKHRMQKPEQTFAPMFDQCGFGGNLTWYDDIIDRTTETYQALADWSGFS